MENKQLEDTLRNLTEKLDLAQRKKSKHQLKIQEIENLTQKLKQLVEENKTVEKDLNSLRISRQKF